MFVLFSPFIAAQAHTPGVFTVIIKDDRPYPDHIPEETKLVEGGGVWFRMMDSTNNSTIRVSIDIDGNGYFNESEDYFSPWMVFECEYDENGTLLDSECVESDVFYFNGSNGTGIYDYQVERMVNGSHTDPWINTIFVGVDDHSESTLPNVGDCFGSGCESDDDVVTSSDSEGDNKQLISILMVISVVGLIGVSISLINEKNDENDKNYLKSYSEEE